MAKRHSGEEGDGDGVMDEVAPILSPAAAVLAVDGDFYRPGGSRMVGDQATSMEDRLVLPGDEGLKPSNDQSEMAGKVSNLVGLFNRNEAGKSMSSSTLSEEDVNLDKIEAQALQLSPIPLLNEEELQVGDRNYEAVQSKTDTTVNQARGTSPSK